MKAIIIGQNFSHLGTCKRKRNMCHQKERGREITFFHLFTVIASIQNQKQKLLFFVNLTKRFETK
jgi:hypothetical protein